MTYGRFDDVARSYVIENPCPPAPWINYLGNRRLQAFISQNAGGLLWHMDTEAKRITRYQYVGSPSDRPGFYVYIKDRRTSTNWNPHFAPICAKLDRFECRHSPGATIFSAAKDGIEATAQFLIPPQDDVLIYHLRLTNTTAQPADLLVASYLEFGILELPRELWWAYIQRTCLFRYHEPTRSIRYDYLPFEAEFSPSMGIGCSLPVCGFDASREAFIGRDGSLERPAALSERGFSNSQLPLGGHGCGALGTELTLASGQSEEFSFVFAIADRDEQVDALLAKYYEPAAVRAGIDANRQFWEQRLGTLTLKSPDPMVDRFINTWNGYQSLSVAQLPSSVNAEHMGIDGLRYRDATQACLTPANLDPQFAIERMDLIFASQKPTGEGSYIFRPFRRKPKINDDLKRSDNTVWSIYTVKNILGETGDLAYLDRNVPYRDGTPATVYDHVLHGLEYIYNNRGPQGLPLMFYADWNDCLVPFCGDVTESIMLGMQLAYSCQEMAGVAERVGRSGDAAWCRKVSDELLAIINSDKVWDGRWYRRLLLADGKCLGTHHDPRMQIWINPQIWSVICGAGKFQNRGELAMRMVHERLNSPIGLVKQDPPQERSYNPDTRKPMGVPPGIAEIGGIFNHTNTWAIMAECLLGHNERAFEYYRRCIPAVVAERFGQDHYLREPYCYVSAVVGPIHELFGMGGISWITGTATWMYHVATQYVLGIRPTLDGLMIQPCLPAAMDKLHVQRRFRGAMFEIEIHNAARPASQCRLEFNGREIVGTIIPAQPAGSVCRVRCFS